MRARPRIYKSSLFAAAVAAVAIVQRISKYAVAQVKMRSNEKRLPRAQSEDVAKMPTGLCTLYVRFEIFLVRCVYVYIVSPT